MSEPLIETASSSRHRIRANTRSKLLRKYGLTPEAYDSMLKGQDYRCKICRTDKARPRCTRQAFRTFAVDHNHETGEVRGLLCNNCNAMLGLAADNPIILLKAIQYLKGKL